MGKPKLLNEQDMLQEAKRLVEIKQEWNKFAEIVNYFERAFLQTRDMQKKIGKQYALPVEYLIHLKEDVSQMVIYKNHGQESYEKIVSDFKEAIENYPIAEMLANYTFDDPFGLEAKDFAKILKNKKNAKLYLDEFLYTIDKYRKSRMGMLLLLLKKFEQKKDLDSYQNISTIREIRYLFDQFAYNESITEELKYMSHFILEIDALIKINSNNLRNYQIAKKVCESKLMDLSKEGLLFHYTKHSIWHASSIVKFIDEGIKPSYLLDRESIKSLFPDAICFFLSCERNGVLNHSQFGAITFVLSEQYVTEHHFEFYYNQYKETRNENSVNFESLCKKLGFNQKDLSQRKDNTTGYKDVEYQDEVQTYRVIPYSAIGAIIVEKRFEYRLQYFMAKLAHKNPDLTIPIYNRSGNLIWPV